VWDLLDKLWEDKFLELRAFKAIHGHCNVPDNWSENPKLGNWVHNQRAFRKKRQLSEDRIQRLDEIGLVWDSRDVSWEEMFAALAIYRENNGHCNVPHLCSKNPKLGKWVHKQRQKRKNNQLSEEQIRRLDQIGLIWNPSDSTWEEKFAELLIYKEINGHCNVPNHWSKNQQLGEWVANQRAFRKKGLLSEERIQRLTQIGFVWNILDAAWEQKFAELLTYKEINGHCKVPVKESDNPQLGSWVDRQRTFRKKDKLSEDRIQRLDEIGFVWELKSGKRSQC
jgi:hypothetical protein